MTSCYRAVLVVIASLASAGPARGNTCAVHATDFLEPSLLSGPLHTVQPCAQIVGHMARFKLMTKFGEQTVDSVEMVHVRIDELPAIDALERTNAALLGARAAGSEALDRGNSVARVVTHPIETVKGLPQGVLRFFQRRYDKIAGRLGKLGSRARDEITNADDGYQRPSARPGVVAQAGNGRNRTLADKAGREAHKQALDYVSYQSSRRKWARKLGVDPYTTNPMLRERLDALSWAAVAGEQAANLAFAALPSSVLDSLGTARDLNTYVLDVPEEDLKRRNAALLADVGCGEVETQRFLRRGAFSPPLQTRFVAALVAIAPASGCVDVVDLATAVRGEIEARYLVNALELLAREKHGAARLALAGTTVVLRPMSGDIALDAASERAPLVLPLAVDRLEWTSETRAFFDEPALRVADKTAIVAGELSPRARRALTRRGWSLRENVPRPLPPLAVVPAKAGIQPHDEGRRAAPTQPTAQTRPDLTNRPSAPTRPRVLSSRAASIPTR